MKSARCSIVAFAVLGAGFSLAGATETAKWQAEIDAVSAKGGGRVTVGKGVHAVGTLWLRSNVELHLEDGAVLMASTDKADYNALDAFPENFSVPAENWVGRHLIIAHSVTNVALTGAGIVDGRGEDFFEDRVWGVATYGRRAKMRGDEPSRAARRSGTWMHGIRWSRRWDDPRPGQMVLFVKCANVRVEGVALVNSPCWNLHIWGCDRATVRDVTVRASRSAANTDGIDIDCSSDVTVEHCDFDVGDDGVAVRGSEKRLGIHKPCERVTVRDCSIAACSAPFRFGVGTGLVRDVLVENCRVWRGGAVLTFSCSYEGRGGCDIENITVRNVIAEGCAGGMSGQHDPLGPNNEFGVRNVKVENCDFARSPADYGVVADGKAVRLHKCRQSAHPFNWWWTGVERPYDQTEEAAFASVTAAGPVSFAVTLPKGASAERPTVRPRGRGCSVEKDGNVCRFTVPGPGQYVFEPDGTRRHALALFVNPPKTWNEKWTRTFGPGEHYVGMLALKSGDRIFLDEGAVLHGSIVGDGVSDVKVCGYGVVDTGCYQRYLGSAVTNRTRSVSNLALFGSRDVTVDGPVFIDAAQWCVTAFDCDRIVCDNVKVTGQWRYNTDGLDVCNSRDVKVRNSFIHAFDDALVVKGRQEMREKDVRNVSATNCVLWCDWGRTCEVGIETWAPVYRNVSFVDCDLIHNSAVALDVQAGGNGRVEDVLFRNLRVECDADDHCEVLQSRRGETYPERAPKGQPYLLNIDNHKPWEWSCKERYSDIANVTVEGVTVYLAEGQKMPPTYVKSVDPANPLGQLGRRFPRGEACKQPGEKPRAFIGVTVAEPKVIRVGK